MKPAVELSKEVESIREWGIEEWGQDRPPSYWRGFSYPRYRGVECETREDKT